MRKLFLLEDDLSLISGLTFAFKKQGFALDTARTLAEAEVLWSDRKYDLLVLDVSLPDGSGFDFCQKVRRTSNVPILFLTASDEEMNIIMGLELGGGIGSHAGHRMAYDARILFRITVGFSSAGRLSLGRAFSLFPKAERTSGTGSPANSKLSGW